MTQNSWLKMDLSENRRRFNRTSFLQTFRPQSFALRDSLILYITKNPSTPKVYEKLIQTCKYFFIKNPILVVSVFEHFLDYDEHENGEWKTYIDNKFVVLKNILSKIWISNKALINGAYAFEKQSLYPLNFALKIYRCVAKKCVFEDLDIFYKEFIILVKKCEVIENARFTVMDDNGSVVALEKIVEVLPCVKNFRYSFDEMGFLTISKIVTSKTVQGLLKISHFRNILDFTLEKIPESFDIERFFNYIKEIKTMHIYLLLGDDNISQEYETHVRTIIKEIIETDNRDYDPPFISFWWMDEDLLYKLSEVSTRRSYR